MVGSAYVVVVDLNNEAEIILTFTTLSTALTCKEYSFVNCAKIMYPGIPLSLIARFLRDWMYG